MQNYRFPRPPPFFSETVRPTGLKIFFKYFDQIGVRIFLFLKSLFQQILTPFTKINTTEKSKIFTTLLLILDGDGIFEEKSTHANLVEVLAKKLLALSVEPFRRKRGKTSVKFWIRRSQNIPEDCVYDNFCSTYRHLSTLKVSEIFATPFLRNTGRGGPLNLLRMT